MSQFIHPLTDHYYEEYNPNAADSREWTRVYEVRELEDGGLMCRRDSNDTLTYLKAGQWRKVRAGAA